ncbi:MAG: zinc-dependent metalloprotease [Acidimicrobiia bacterium]|nr:zinc-dependent metalloprotease [Acidimicrobiia bacterium]
MSDDDPLEPDNPLGMFADLAKLFGGSAAGGNDAARQLALAVATDGQSEPNVDPADRIRIEQLARVAELQIAEATGLSVASGALEIEGVNRAGWVQRSLDAYDPILGAMSQSLSAGLADTGPLDASDDDPMASMFAGIFSMMGPLMLSMTTGSMIGHLARRSMGVYDLPIPRPASDRLFVVVPNLAEFGDDWSLSIDDLTLWVCLHEVAHHAVLNVPHVRDRLLDLLSDHAGAFRPDPSALEDKIGTIDLAAGPEGLGALQEVIGDPDAVLGVVQSDAQRQILPFLAALVAAVEGYIDHVMDEVGGRLIETYPMLTEALRRRRVEADASDRFVERIFGLELTQHQYDRGAAFVAGVVERAGVEALGRLWESADTLPTPNEIDAPGLWLARIDLPADQTDD